MADMQRIKRELKYAGAVVDVYADTMKFKNGNTEVWDTVLHKKERQLLFRYYLMAG